MAEVVAKGRETSRAPKPLSANDAARAKAALLKKAFEGGKQEAATPSQISEAKSEVEKITKIREWIMGHLNALAFYTTEKYNTHSEKSRMCVALYILKNLEVAWDSARQNKDSASYSLFISTAKAAGGVLAPDLFLDNRDEELMYRFAKVQPHFEACAFAFGTQSLGLQEVQDKFGFQLGSLVSQRKKEGLQ